MDSSWNELPLLYSGLNKSLHVGSISCLVTGTVFAMLLPGFRGEKK